MLHTWPCFGKCGRMLTLADILRSESGYCRQCLQAHIVMQHGSIEAYDKEFLASLGVRWDA